MSNIIISHIRSVGKGFNDLAEEFSDLQGQVSVLRTERNVLLETINNLNGEIRQMSAKLPLAEPEVQEFDSSEVDITDVKEECVESLGIKSETEVGEKCIYYGDVLDESVKQKNRYPIDNHVSVVHEWDNVDDNNSVHIAQEKVVRSNLYQEETKQNQSKFSKKTILNPPKDTFNSEIFVCKVCNFTFSTSKNLRIHMNNVHSNFEQSKVSKVDNEESMEQVNAVHDNARSHVCEECGYASLRKSMLKRHWDAVHNKGEKKHKCEKCPHSSASKCNLRVHINRVHDKIRNHACNECEYTSLFKDSVKRHWDAVHNKGDKKFKCDKCPYSSAEKNKLKSHRISVHNIGGQKFKCEECPYSTAERGNLKQHIKGVHENVRNHVCEECGYASALKSDLKRHHINVHKKGTI